MTVRNGKDGLDVHEGTLLPQWAIAVIVVAAVSILLVFGLGVVVVSLADIMQITFFVN